MDEEHPVCVCVCGGPRTIRKCPSEFCFQGHGLAFSMCRILGHHFNNTSSFIFFEGLLFIHFHMSFLPLNARFIHFNVANFFFLLLAKFQPFSFSLHGLESDKIGKLGHGFTAILKSFYGSETQVLTFPGMAQNPTIWESQATILFPGFCGLETRFSGFLGRINPIIIFSGPHRFFTTATPPPDSLLALVYHFSQAFRFFFSCFSKKKRYSTHLLLPFSTFSQLYIVLENLKKMGKMRKFGFLGHWRMELKIFL